MIMRKKEEPHRRISVPRHEEIARGTLRAILNEVGLTPEEFSRLL
jgi:HicA toxin of bacterial toxin-antitoxin,